MLRRALQGAAISSVGLASSYVGVSLAVQHDVLQVPALTAPVLLFVSSGYMVMGAGSAFFSTCEDVLLAKGFVRGMVLQSYAQKTTWASKITVRGEELEPIVKSMMRTEPFIKLTVLQQESDSAFRRVMYGLVSQSDLYEALMREVAPFARSEKVVADRLRGTLVEAAEKVVLHSIQSQRIVFTGVMAMSMFVASVITLSLDRSFPQEVRLFARRPGFGPKDT